MQIQINEKYRLRSDAYNIILEEKTITKASKNTLAENIGKERWDSIGFYPTIEKALNDHLNKQIRFDDSEGIDLLLETINNVRTDIQSLKITYERDGQAEETEELKEEVE